jgi:prepilin-type N-terminal cleavage/methylation domain-containing protein
MCSSQNRTQVNAHIRTTARRSIGLRRQSGQSATPIQSEEFRFSGFTLVEIVIVVALLGLLAIVAIPNFLRTRTTAQQNACINNLRLIDGAIQQWAMEQRKAGTSAVFFTDISPYLKDKIVCPAGGSNFADSYTISTVAAGPLCQQSPLTHLLPWTAGEVAIAPPPDAGGAGSAANSNGAPAARPPPPGHATHPPAHGGFNGNGDGNGGNGSGNGNGNHASPP